jgi:phage portal protein BeeE
MGHNATDHAAVYDYLRGLERGAPSGVSMGAQGYGSGGPVWLDGYHSKRPPSPAELVDAYKSVAYACIQLNAQGVAKVPLNLYSKTGPKDKAPRRAVRSLERTEEKRLRELPHVARSLGPRDELHQVMEHPFLEALESPNPFFDGNLLLLYLTISLDVVGMAYIFPVRPDASWAARELWPLQAQYIYPVKGVAGNLLQSYRYFGDTFQPDELVRIRRLSMRDPYLSAYAPLHACFEELGLSGYYTGSVESILKGGARPGGIVGPKNDQMPWGEPERKRFEVDINNRFTGGNSGRIWVTNGAFDFHSLTFPPADLAGLEITKWERLLIANCLDVPISLLQAEDSNRAVASEGTHQHQYYAIEPRCRLIASALTHQLAKPVDPRLFFAFDDPVQRDNEREAKIIDMKLKNGTVTINEDRAENGLPAVAWGDEPWQSNTLVQPSTAAEDRDRKQVAAETMAAQLANGAKVDPEEVDDEPAPKPSKKPKPAKADDADGETETETEERSASWTQLYRILDTLEDHIAAANDFARTHGHSGPQIDHEALIESVLRRHGVLEPGPGDGVRRTEDDPPGQPAAAGDPGGPGGPGRDQLLRAAGWQADQDGDAGLVRPADGHDPGAPADDRGPAAGDVPEPGEL